MNSITKHVYRAKPASQSEILLFTLMGQALLKIQLLEECLSTSITLKVDVGYPYKISKADADEKLTERLRKNTLGQAIDEAKTKNLYAEDVQSSLKALQERRNWFIHRIVDDVYNPAKREELFLRIKSIVIEAHRIQCKIEDDLIIFAEDNGLDMSSVKNSISQWQH